MEPKKYIRTFASDMDILQKGGIPDLAPLKTLLPIPTPPVTATPEPTTIPAPIPASNEGHVSAAPLSIPVSRIEPEPIPVPEPEPTPEPILIPVPEPPPAPPSPLETYSSDFMDHMRDLNASAATVLAAEEDAASALQPVAPKSSSNVLYLLTGTLLLIAGGLGIYFAYTSRMSTPVSDVLASTIATPIVVEDKEQISGVGSALARAIQQSVARPLASGTMRLLYTVANDNIFSALQFPAPDVFLRNINALGSMVGVIDVAGSQSPFFILSTASYGETFSGMLSWESTMPHDLGTLFPAYAVASTTATSTIAGFRDEVVNNHDTRVYRDAQKRTILLYGYWDQKTLVIARNEAAFTEILNRLASAHTP